VASESPNGDAQPEPSRPARSGNGRGAKKACPSAPCEEGALLLGVMTSSGRLAYLQPPTKVDAEFVAKVKARGRPEQAYRFSSPCVEAACPQWTGESCGIGEMIAQQAETVPEPRSTGLPTCAIRSSCRWYSEQGRDACMVCPLIVADTGGTETYRSMQARDAISGSDGQA
jgi:hypothetical protein